MITVIAAIVFYSCEKTDDSVIDPSVTSPLLSNPQLSKDTVRTTSSGPVINFTASVSASTNGGTALQSIVCSVSDPHGNLLAQINMTDNGVSPDTTTGDGRFTAAIDITGISCLQVGNYEVEYLAVNTSGLSSNLISSSIPVINTNNQPPVVSALHAPSVILVPPTGTNTGVLSVFTDDPDGRCDINSVFFNSFRPDGSITNGSPFTMFDDGNISVHGDTVAGDGRYSLKIEISSAQTTLGYFKFNYQAQDNSNLLSNIIRDSINVTH
ncbi:MAG: hypothetical protein ABI462_06860 [Ignavibacteria bacterium]